MFVKTCHNLNTHHHNGRRQCLHPGKCQTIQHIRYPSVRHAPYRRKRYTGRHILWIRICRTRHCARERHTYAQRDRQKGNEVDVYIVFSTKIKQIDNTVLVLLEQTYLLVVFADDVLFFVAVTIPRAPGVAALISMPASITSG